MTSPGEFPFVSVVMPIRNERPYISRSLNAALAQDYPADRMEVIVADGQSTDGTREFVRSLQSAHPNLKLLDNAGRIAPTGLNAAVAVSKGEILVRVDGHCEISRDYVRGCVRLLREHGVEAVGGPLDTIGETPLSRVIAVATSSRFGVGGSAFRTVRNQTVLTDTVAFPAYTREAIERAGPFDEELLRNQDDEYNYRLRELGGRVLLSEEIPVRYWSRGSLRSLWRQYFQYGFFKVRVFQKHPRQMRARQFVPPLFVGSLIVAISWAPFSAAGAWTLLGVAVAYAVANLASSVEESRRLESRTRPVLPLAFAILHFAYGLGFWVGLARFWNRWQWRGRRRSGRKAPKEGVGAA
ncbi:MAG: glycosyltransferase family 2 protein [Thermoanaerobaculia bacterium]